MSKSVKRALHQAPSIQWLTNFGVAFQGFFLGLAKHTHDLFKHTHTPSDSIERLLQDDLL